MTLEQGIRCPKCGGETEVRKTIQCHGHVLRSRRCLAKPPCGSITTREAVIGAQITAESISRPKIDFAIRNLLEDLGISMTSDSATDHDPQN